MDLVIKHNKNVLLHAALTCGSQSAQYCSVRSLYLKEMKKLGERVAQMLGKIDGSDR